MKVDCSYLGPHMQMAERLETATKLYGTPLLLSEDFVALMSTEKKRVRLPTTAISCGRSVLSFDRNTYDRSEPDN